MVARWGERARLEVAVAGGEPGGPAVRWHLSGQPGLEAVLELQDPSAGAGWRPAPFGAILPSGPWPSGPGGPLRLDIHPASPQPGAALQVPAEGLKATLRLGTDLEPLFSDQVPSLIEEAARWQRAVLPSASARLALAPSWAREAVAASLEQLHALQHRESGLLVAAPVTSIPQWPGSPRAWDYRYAWLRDNADAGTALALGGDLEGARHLARGLAELLRQGTQPVRRLDGGPLPPERSLPHLRGYLGALVRVGNGAAQQAQVDTLGEVCRFAHLLEQVGGCPPQLLDQVPRLADAAAIGWPEPDHGIWEVRGRRRHYLHSKILAWVALDRALDLAGHGKIEASGAASWAAARGELEEAVARRGTGPSGELTMAFGEPSTDSATLAAYLVGYPLPEGGRRAGTLDHVLGQLGTFPLVARHRPERDGIPYPCLPFIFPSFWAAAAEAACGRREAAVARFRSLIRLAGPSRQLSEVAEPASRRMLGNYPQVQSHAALVEAALVIWGPAAPPGPAAGTRERPGIPRGA
jgi:GH15 family glucan-1,4-alpha-glucosidase